MRVLEADFYERPVVDVARDLLGCTLRVGRCAGVIVETEAYHQDEPACHAFRGERPHNRSLFAGPGTAYVYRSYGIHVLLNAVCEPAGIGSAVLIRALEPTEGIETMRRRRGRPDRELCAGPGRLGQALGVSLSLDGEALAGPQIEIHPRTGAAPDSVSSPRIGITRATELPWRFSVAGSGWVSRPRPVASRSRA